MSHKFALSIPCNFAAETRKTVLIMNVIMIESAAFQELVGHIEKIAEHIRRYEDRQTVQPQERWVNSKEVTALLGISLRTLQRYRDEGRIPFSLMGRTCRYRLTDVEHMMKECSMSGNTERIGELHRQYMVRIGKKT